MMRCVGVYEIVNIRVAVFLRTGLRTGPKLGKSRTFFWRVLNFSSELRSIETAKMRFWVVYGVISGFFCKFRSG